MFEWFLFQFLEKASIKLPVFRHFIRSFFVKCIKFQKINPIPLENEHLEIGSLRDRAKSIPKLLLVVSAVSMLKEF